MMKILLSPYHYAIEYVDKDSGSSVPLLVRMKELAFIKHLLYVPSKVLSTQYFIHNKDGREVWTLPFYMQVGRWGGEGNGNPLQYSCLENPMDGGAWWAAVHEVAKSRTDWETSLSVFTFIHWRRKWQPTPVFLPGESQGRGSLVGCCLWGCTDSDTTEAT